MWLIEVIQIKDRKNIYLSPIKYPKLAPKYGEKGKTNLNNFLFIDIMSIEDTLFDLTFAIEIK